MLPTTVLFYLTFLYLVNPQFQINFHLTNPTINDENFQHDCLRVPTNVENDTQPYQVISYCMGELQTKFQIKQNNIDQQLTFLELAEQNITSEQLYQWSASIDLIENYQLYLNEIRNSKKSSMEKEVFYNCTFPYFGSQCQYVFSDYKSNYLSLDEFIHDYYRYHSYEPTLFTCYVHLECNRGFYPACLDWTEICDGKVDCLNDGIDEKDCWQLELQQCHDDEHQCSDGQCIPEEFLYDDPINPDCIDMSDERLDSFDLTNIYSNEPTFRSEDISCLRQNQKHIELLNLQTLTSSCVKQRNILLSQTMFLIKSNQTSNECWTGWKWFIQMPVEASSTFSMDHRDVIDNQIIKKYCSNLTYIPAIPVLLGHVYLVHDKHAIKYGTRFLNAPTYMCYNNRLLYVPNDDKTVILNNNTCRSYADSSIPLMPRNMGWLQTVLTCLYKWLTEQTATIETHTEILNGTTVTKCVSWPLLGSKRLLFNNITNCSDSFDLISSSSNLTCSEEQEKNLHYFKCLTTNECIPRQLVGDVYCHCTRFDRGYCDDRDFDISYTRNHISFQTICDGYIHLAEKFLRKYNETDETNCQYWPSIHIYNHCDDLWHLLNGADEINCDQSPLINCPPNHHICISPQTNQLICLPIEKVNDGIMDCLGAQDEPKECRNSYDGYSIFYCHNSDFSPCISSNWICDNGPDCDNNEDEQACTSNDYLMSSRLHGICEQNYELYGSDAVKILCRNFISNDRRRRTYFTVDQRMNLLRYNVEHNISQIVPDQLITREIEYYQPRCHRGIDLQVWLDKRKNLTTNVCLCPPSYYGSQCQYQNQRVSLTLQFRITSDSIQTPFIIIVSLIDDSNERIIHSSEQFIYLPMKNCRRRYNIYLLYSTRPKDLSKEYSIHIDIYEKTTLNYRTSFIKTFNSSFLPVHRLAYILNIPPSIDDLDYCSDDECMHGKCIKYNHDQRNRTFCRCDRDWYGQYCTIEYDCQCSDNAICLGKLANNRSLCVCPLDKTGPRCLVNDNICQNNKTATCYNNGQCIPTDEYGLSTKKFICICKKGSYGDRCEKIGTELIISYDNTISLSSSVIFIHFIEVKINAEPIRTTTVKKADVVQDSITIHWSLPFHIVFIQLLNKTYYLMHLEKFHNSSSTIRKTITLSDQCLNISEVFNQTIATLELLRRIKYYHLPCQTNSSQLLCFHDEVHMCFCQEINGHGRVANCLEFTHNATYDCSGKSGCIHGGTCYQENTTCPRISVCQCPRCYYGTRCQFSTTSYTLSLDAILGYHIQQHLSISQQSSAVLISLTITIIITILGFINGTLCLITFKNKSTRESGCGIYLLSSSIITIIIMIIFLLKYLILLFSQMGSIDNRLFLNIQCRSLDFVLRSTLTINEWLTTFIAMERAFIVIKTTQFNKKKSQLVAKWMIIGLILLIIVINVYDPIYRSLFDEYDDDEKRIWCIVKYPSALETIHSMIQIFHFIVPFVINIISAIIIISKSARQQAAVHKNRTYKEFVNEQIQQHKNLLIGPCVLVFFGIPRLIIVFAPGCMKSSKDAWLYLLGYYISLVPPLLTFILFVLPSTAYKQAFKKAISHYRHIVRRNE